MTTTLRPAGPEQRTGSDDGGTVRRRAYDICVNGRRAGAVELAAAAEDGLVTGRITRLTVDEADRRSGRATVAALAAEEVLRGWGARRVVVSVPAAGPALRLATVLGYTERSRRLLKPMGPPVAAAGSAGTDGGALAPMTDAHYGAWLARDHAALAARRTADGVRPDRAAAAAGRARRSLLPDGPATTGMAFRRLLHDGVDVGTLWLRLDGAPHPDADAWVHAVEVAEQHRGRGHGRTLMRAAERMCREAGRRVLGLDVEAGNVPALALHASLGYRPVEHLLSKPLL